LVITLDTGLGTDSSVTSRENGFKSLGKPRAISNLATTPTILRPARVGSHTGKWRSLRRFISSATAEMVSSGEIVTGSGVIHFSTNMVRYRLFERDRRL